MDGRTVSGFQTRHIQDEAKVVTTIAGETTTEDDVDALAGDVVLSEKRDKKWTHTLVDNKPAEKQQKALDKLAGWDDEDQIPRGKTIHRSILGRGPHAHEKAPRRQWWRSVSGKAAKATHSPAWKNIMARLCARDRVRRAE